MESIDSGPKSLADAIREKLQVDDDNDQDILGKCLLKCSKHFVANLISSPYKTWGEFVKTLY